MQTPHTLTNGDALHRSVTEPSFVSAVPLGCDCSEGRVSCTA